MQNFASFSFSDAFILIKGAYPYLDFLKIKKTNNSLKLIDYLKNNFIPATSTTEVPSLAQDFEEISVEIDQTKSDIEEEIFEAPVEYEEYEETKLSFCIYKDNQIDLKPDQSPGVNCKHLPLCSSIENEDDSSIDLRTGSNSKCRKLPRCPEDGKIDLRTIKGQELIPGQTCIPQCPSDDSIDLRKGNQIPGLTCYIPVENLPNCPEDGSIDLRSGGQSMIPGVTCRPKCNSDDLIDIRNVGSVPGLTCYISEIDASNLPNCPEESVIDLRSSGQLIPGVTCKPKCQIDDSIDLRNSNEIPGVTCYISLEVNVPLPNCPEEGEIDLRAGGQSLFPGESCKPKCGTGQSIDLRQGEIPGVTCYTVEDESYQGYDYKFPENPLILPARQTKLPVCTYKNNGIDLRKDQDIPGITCR